MTTSNHDTGKQSTPEMKDELYHPLWKERVVFRESSEDVFALDIYIEAGGDPRGPAHVHPLRDERARLVAGSALLILNGEERTLSAGDVVIIPAGASHAWRSVDSGGFHLDLEYRPGIASGETFFRTYFGWAQEGRLRQNGLPRLTDWAVLFAETQDFVVAANPPLLVQRALAGLLAPVARRRGHNVR
jgi:quercetin dioxygenase-like cupin family protein